MDNRSATQQMRRDGMDYIAISRELGIPLGEVIAYARDTAPGPKRPAQEPQVDLHLRGEIDSLRQELHEAHRTIEQLQRELNKMRAPCAESLVWSKWMTAGAASAKLGIAGHTTIWRTCALGHDLDGRYFEARHVRPTDTHINHGTQVLVRYSLLPTDIKRSHQR